MAEQKAEWLEDRLAAAKTKAEYKKILKEWDEEKNKRAYEKEERLLNDPSPSIVDRFLDAIDRVKGKIKRKQVKDNAIAKNQQNSR